MRSCVSAPEGNGASVGADEGQPLPHRRRRGLRAERASRRLADDSGRLAVAPGSGARELRRRELTCREPTRYVGRACDGDPPVPPAAGAAFAVVVARCLARSRARRARLEGGRLRRRARGQQQGTRGLRAVPDDRPGGDSGLLGGRERSASGCSTGGGSTSAACRAGLGRPLPGRRDGNRGRPRNASARSSTAGATCISSATGRGSSASSTRTRSRRRWTRSTRAAAATSPCTRSRPRTSGTTSRTSRTTPAGLRVIRIDEGQDRRGRPVHRRAPGTTSGVSRSSATGGREYVAASDIDFGLYVFRYTGD